MYCGKTGAAGAAFSEEAAELDVAAFSDGLNSSISFFTLLPPSELPFTSFKLLHLSCANFLANGDAFTLLSSSDDDSAGAEVSFLGDETASGVAAAGAVSAFSV